MSKKTSPDFSGHRVIIFVSQRICCSILFWKIDLGITNAIIWFKSFEFIVPFVIILKKEDEMVDI